MKLLKKIFTGIFAVVFTTVVAFGAPNCDDASYRRSHPEKCASGTSEFFTPKTTLLTIAGGAALVGIGVALASQTSGGGGSSSTISNQNSFPRIALSSNININYAQTDQISNRRASTTYMDSLTHGTDIDDSIIQHIKSQDKYQRNYKQYDAVNFAWAHARGLSGKNTTINVLDDFYSNHGQTVSEIVQNIAPDAIVTNYNIASYANSFNSFDYITNTLVTSGPAQIYNASWQVPASDSVNAATAIYQQNYAKTYAQAQEYMYNTTNENFITQIRNLAVDNDAIFVWASGNESQSESGVLSAMPLAFPDLQGHFVNVVALDNAGKIAWYSNQCGITQNYCIAAPGSGWHTDAQEYASGTSFATPVVSGAIAVIKEAFPYMNASQITALLFTTATDLGAPGIDSVYGWGLLDMEKATKPVGTPKIVLSNNNIQPLNMTNVSGLAAVAIKNANLTIAFVDDFGRAFTTNLSDHINVIPYGRGFDKLRENDQDSFVLFDKFEFGFKQNNLLESYGLISAKSNELTNFIGLKNEFNIENVKFYQNARIGVSHPTPDNDSIISDFSNIYTSTIKMGAQFKDFSAEIAIPDTIISGSMNMNIPIGRANNGQIIYNDAHIDLTSSPSIEYTLKYKYLSATYVNNPSYQNELFIMAKTKFQF